MVRTWRRELGLAREKHRTTTSDLEGETRCSVQDCPLSQERWETQLGEGWRSQSRAISQEEKVPAERQRADRKEKSKKVSAESLNTLSHDVKTHPICLWKELVQQLQGILGECKSHKACGCVSETGPLGF